MKFQRGWNGKIIIMMKKGIRMLLSAIRNGTLLSVMFRERNGYVLADHVFFLAVLKGEYFDGESLEFEKALHENFFGKIEE